MREEVTLPMRDFYDIKRSAIRYWEWRRLFYNLALVLPAFIGYSMGITAAARHGLVRQSGAEVVILLFVLWAIPGNICYTFAYALEFIFGNDLQTSRWLRSGRTLAFVSGTLFAVMLAFFGGSTVSWMVFRYK